jgi:hydroxyethylthiazole kinase-like uncharacterized protein yjeF
VAVPEALVLGLPETAGGELDPDGAGEVLELAGSCDAVLVGPGMLGVEASRDLVAALLPDLQAPLVLDAVGLAYLDGRPEALQRLDGRAVLTPNPAELARVLGVDAAAVEQDPAGIARQLAGKTGATVACGGAVSWVVDPQGRTWLSGGGGAGLGVSGSGDVLAGVVTGLLARGAEPAQAAIWATHVHGRAGDRLAADVGPLGFLAREVVAQVPRVLVELHP